MTSVKNQASGTSPSNTDFRHDRVVELHDVGMEFRARNGSTRAIDSLTAHVDKGAFVSVIGPSGCGKSTLLDLVCGLQRPTSGQLSVNGELVTGPRRDTAMVFQEDSTLHWRTVVDNVGFGLEVRGVTKRVRREASLDALRQVGLAGFENHRPGQLSGGMKQRVAIARALVLRPELLLMDEPFGALDQQTRWIVGAELTRAWEASPTSVLFVTHDIQEAVLLSDEVWVLSRRPSRIKKRLKVEIPRPRTAEVIRDAQFQGYVGELWKLLSEEFSENEGFR